MPPRLGASKGDHDLPGYRSLVFLWRSEHPSNAEQKVMNCFLTGGSGFIGANLIHELAARGHRVKALLRPKSDRRGLSGAEYEVIEGDVLDKDSLARGLKGSDWCFHVAASYHLWLRDYRPMYSA